MKGPNGVWLTRRFLRDLSVLCNAWPRDLLNQERRIMFISQQRRCIDKGQRHLSKIEQSPYYQLSLYWLLLHKKSSLNLYRVFGKHQILRNEALITSLELDQGSINSFIIFFSISLDLKYKRHLSQDLQLVSQQESQ